MRWSQVNHVAHYCTARNVPIRVQMTITITNGPAECDCWNSSTGAYSFYIKFRRPGEEWGINSWTGDDLVYDEGFIYYKVVIIEDRGFPRKVSTWWKIHSPLGLIEWTCDMADFEWSWGGGRGDNITSIQIVFVILLWQGYCAGFHIYRVEYGSILKGNGDLT